MAQPEFTPFVELLDKIAGFCAQGDTATIMLVSDDNRMAQIHLDNGRIVFVLCRGRRGRDGLDILRTIQNARMSLDRPSVGSNEPLPWSTEAILDYLYGSITELPEGSSASTLLAGVARRPAAAPEAASKPASSKPALSAAQRTIFEETLATYIGPMAAIVCGDYFDEISDLRQLTLKLAGEIANADQAAKFKAEIVQALGIRL
ncbi:hypothetical protein [Duganella sp. Root198D2]|uniref:hypothetical protein n=1 Tax=Duganella sp. Root198D2 TaxID=1736489 RepID=UPI0006F66661|nr:hypothetical protein [Duganella sp. Root198D2]KQV46429.1 hypothetical protein ASD07_13170 [Duganella sp. Root336D2]KRC02221.1 hypothetical protein ASE26_19355 [Duganella sp. Root198D2]